VFYITTIDKKYFHEYKNIGFWFMYGLGFLRKGWLLNQPFLFLKMMFSGFKTFHLITI